MCVKYKLNSNHINTKNNSFVYKDSLIDVINNDIKVNTEIKDEFLDQKRMRANSSQENDFIEEFGSQFDTKHTDVNNNILSKKNTNIK